MPTPIKARPAPKRAAAPSAPAGIPASDWRMVQQVAKAHGVDPYLLVSIGVHETQWGTQGAGRPASQGGASNILGYGAFDSNPNNPQYSGLSAQLNGAAGLLASKGVHNINDLAAYQNAHGTNVYGATSPAWSQGVLNTYSRVKGGKVSIPNLTPQSGTVVPQNAGPTTGTSGMAPNANARVLDEATLKQKSGFASAFFGSDASLHNLIKSAISQGLDPSNSADLATFQAMLKNTPWFHKYNDAQRSWIQLSTSDSATANKQLTQTTQQIIREAASEGVSLNAQQAAKLAHDALYNGFDANQITQGILGHLTALTTQGGGASVTNQLKGIANANLVPISDQSMLQWEKQVLAKTATPEDFLAYVKDQAKSRFPGLTAYLDSSPTASVSTYVDPYRQDAAQTLGINPDSINFLDPRWSKALDQRDPKTGAPTTMTRSDWINSLRTDPVYGYDHTHQAGQDQDALGKQLLSGFGI